jgi:hypothetical protein
MAQRRSRLLQNLIKFWVCSGLVTKKLTAKKTMKTKSRPQDHHQLMAVSNQPTFDFARAIVMITNESTIVCPNKCEWNGPILIGAITLAIPWALSTQGTFLGDSIAWFGRWGSRHQPFCLPNVAAICNTWEMYCGPSRVLRLVHVREIADDEDK